MRDHRDDVSHELNTEEGRRDTPHGECSHGYHATGEIECTNTYGNETIGPNWGLGIHPVSDLIYPIREDHRQLQQKIHVKRGACDEGLSLPDIPRVQEDSCRFSPVTRID